MYECYKCASKFENQDDAFEHLKIVHKVRNKSHQIKCLKNFNVCQKTYSSFAALKNHHQLCTNIKSDEVTIKDFR